MLADEKMNNTRTCGQRDSQGSHHILLSFVSHFESVASLSKFPFPSEAGVGFCEMRFWSDNLTGKKRGRADITFSVK